MSNTTISDGAIQISLTNNSKIGYYPDRVDEELRAQIFDELITSTGWIRRRHIVNGTLQDDKYETLAMYDVVDMKRRPGHPPSPDGWVESGIQWSPGMLQLKEFVEEVTQRKFDYAMITKFGNGDDERKFHIYSDPGECDVTVTVSLGEPRWIILRHKSMFKSEPMHDVLRTCRVTDRVAMCLYPGSMFVSNLNAACHYWKRKYPVDDEESGAHLSIVFRGL